MGDNIRLEEGITPENLECLYNDPLVQRLRDDLRPMTPIDHPLLTYISVFKGDEFLGAYILIRFSVYECEVHSLLRKSSTKYSKEISEIFLYFVFNNFPVLRITGWIREDLIMAINHCKKYGFRVEGRKRHATLVGGIPKDIVLVGLTRKDWESTL